MSPSVLAELCADWEEGGCPNTSTPIARYEWSRIIVINLDLQFTVFATFYFLVHVAEIFYHIRYAVDILEDACMDLRIVRERV
jgi:hypothetical protein